MQRIREINKTSLKGAVQFLHAHCPVYHILLTKSRKICLFSDTHRQAKQALVKYNIRSTYYI